MCTITTKSCNWKHYFEPLAGTEGLRKDVSFEVKTSLSIWWYYAICKLASLWLFDIGLKYIDDRQLATTSTVRPEGSNENVDDSRTVDVKKARYITAMKIFERRWDDKPVIGGKLWFFKGFAFNGVVVVRRNKISELMPDIQTAMARVVSSLTSSLCRSTAWPMAYFWIFLKICWSKRATGPDNLCFSRAVKLKKKKRKKS